MASLLHSGVLLAVSLPLFFSTCALARTAQPVLLARNPLVVGREGLLVCSLTTTELVHGFPLVLLRGNTALSTSHVLPDVAYDAFSYVSEYRFIVQPSDHRAVYTCIARLPSGVTSDNTTLFVYQGPDDPVISGPAAVVSDVSNSWRCMVDGASSSAPVVYWQLANGTRLSTTFTTQHVYSDANNLDIHNVTIRLTLTPSSETRVLELVCRAIHYSTGISKAANITVTVTATTPTATTGAPRAEHHDVLCGPTSMSFKIPVPALVADNQTLAQTMTLSDPRCRVDVVSSRLTGSTSLNDCGTTLEVTNDSLVFSNAILLPAANDSGVTSLIPIQCRYDRLANLTVSAYLPVVRQVLFTETGVGQLSFRINQYRDATFSSRVADSAYPLRLHSSDDVFVELALGGDQQLEGLGMDVLGCMAIPSSSPAAADAGGVYENLIENNCPASPEIRLLNDHLPAASQNHSLFRFSFKALTFPDPADPQRSRTGVVYIHCRVKLCKSSECRSEGQCPSSSALSRSKRALGGLAEGSAGHQLSTGPLLVDGDSSESNASSPPVVFLGVVAACATLVAMVATVAWRRSRRRGDLQRLDKVTADLQ